MRTIAIMVVRNEERFIANSLKHLTGQGIEVYLIDNESTDHTVAIARQFLNQGLITIDTLPHQETFNLPDVLRRKENLAYHLNADWFMHVDADEIHLPPHSSTTLSQAIAHVDAEGFNAINFFEYTFVPTREHPDHDHPNYLKTMRWYYPFSPAYPRLMRAWKKQPQPVELAWSGGHRVRFPGCKCYPEAFPMRHYLFLSHEHICQKYARRRHAQSAVQAGLHGWRTRFTPDIVHLPSEKELRTYTSDDALDPTNPRVQHHLEEEEWKQRRQQAVEELRQVIPPDATFLLADDNQWDLTPQHLNGRTCLPFTEHQGQYWGPPANDKTAISELESQRRKGADYFVLAWPSFWWLTHYRQLYHHLCENYTCVLINARQIVFEIHTQTHRPPKNERAYHALIQGDRPHESFDCGLVQL